MIKNTKLTNIIDIVKPCEWDIIETAPKDGSHLQLYRSYVQFTGQYNVHFKYWNTISEGKDEIKPPPTHWKTLSESPKTKERKHAENIYLAGGKDYVEKLYNELKRLL